VFGRLAAASLFLLALTACDQKMANQPRYDPLEASDFFKDGQASRPFVEGTVARGTLRENTALYEGKVAGVMLAQVPVKVDEKFLRRGQERYNIYCSMCHGRAGYGNGMIVQRGYRRPPSFHVARLRSEPAGHYFDVISNGYGSMPAYRTMIPTEDRWAIVLYIRALQLSQNAGVDDAAPQERKQLSTGGRTR